ncbi:putative GRAM domain-containing protein 1A [Sesbania bispinosa]|nr:putative GRAM domain-containing protein 1A [Sesbania bispinosa]
METNGGAVAAEARRTGGAKGFTANEESGERRARRTGGAAGFTGGGRGLRSERRTPLCGGRRMKVERRTDGGPFAAVGEEKDLGFSSE